MSKNILITGMSGLIGGLLKDRLLNDGQYKLSALNRSYVDGVSNYQKDITNLNDIKEAFVGQDVVVHLAANLDSNDWEMQQAVNVTGTYNVFEAARQAGVKKVIFASSGSTINAFENISPYKEIATGDYENAPETFPLITHEQIRPLGLYGATKVWGEALARHFTEEYDMSIICVRIGNVKKENRPQSIRENAIYLSHRDITQMLYLCVESDSSIKYDIFYAVSNNKWNYRDLSRAKEVLGFIPQDTADDKMFIN